MGMFYPAIRWWRTQQVKRFERYIQKALARYRYDPKPALKRHHVTAIQRPGQSAMLVYTPPAKKLCYFSADQLDPALVRVAETMLVVYLETAEDASDKPYTILMRDLTSEEGPTDNRQWFHYMHALDRLMPAHPTQVISREVAAMGRAQHLLYAYCRIFSLPMGTVKKRYKDIVSGVHHQTSFTDELITLKDKLSHDPRVARSDHPPPAP